MPNICSLYSEVSLYLRTFPYIVQLLLGVKTIVRYKEDVVIIIEFRYIEVPLYFVLLLFWI